MNHAEEADTLAALPGDFIGRVQSMRTVKNIYMYCSIAMIFPAISCILLIFLSVSVLLKENSPIDANGFFSICAVLLTTFIVTIKTMQHFSKLILQNKLSESEQAQPSITALESENEQHKARITKLEIENAALLEQLEAARREISGKEGLEPAHDEEFPAEYEGHGIFTMVAKLVDDRTPIEGIMRSVSSETGFLTNREAGYFFHPSPEEKAPSTLQNYIKNRVKSEAIS